MDGPVDKTAPVREEEQEDSDEIMMAHAQMEEVQAQMQAQQEQEMEGEHGQEVAADDDDDDDDVEEPYDGTEELPFPDVHDLSEDENDVVEVGDDGLDDDDNDGFILVQPQFNDASGQQLANADAAEEETDFNSEMDTEGDAGASDGGAGDISMTAVPEDPPIDPAVEGFKYWAGWLAHKFR